MSFEESFLYPLILLGIASGVSYALGTKLTQKYQKQQKQRDIDREDLHRSIQIKDDLIRQFSDTTVEFEQMILVIQLFEIKKGSILDIITEFNTLQLHTTKLMLLIKLYFGDENSLYEQFAKFSVLAIITKNYGIKNTPSKLKEMEAILDKLITDKPDTWATAYMEEMGVETNVYTKITTRIGMWGFKFSEEILNTKLKIQN